MFSFLNSVLLPFLIAGLIPLIIHLFSRQKTKRIPFSSLRFLKLLENQRIKQVRIYQILLIIIRTLFILFLVLSFARPTLIDSLFSNSGTAGTTAVIIVDDSYSMQQYRSSQLIFAMANKAADQIVSTFEPNDKIYLLTSQVYENETQPKINIKKPQETLNQLRVSDSSPDFSPLFDQVKNLFDQNPNFNKELFIISDFRINEYNLGKQFIYQYFDESVRTYLVSLELENQWRNASIDTVYIEEQLLEIGKTITLKAKITNHQQETEHQTAIHVFSDDKRVAMQQISVEAAGSQTATLRFVPQTNGYQFIHVELDNDDLSIDNHYYLDFFIPEKIDLLYVDNQPGISIQSAIDALQQNSIIQITQTNFNRIYGTGISNYDLLVLSDPPGTQSNLKNVISDYLASGRNIILIPGSATTPAQINRLFYPSIDQNVVSTLVQPGSNESYFSLREDIAKLPLFSTLFNQQQSKPRLPRFFKYFKQTNPDRTILSLNTGDPLLGVFMGKEQIGSIYVLASDLENDWTDFAMKGVFVPMLHRIIFSASQSVQHRLQKVRNGDISLTLPNKKIETEYELIDPQGDKSSLLPEQNISGLRFNIHGIERPGHYKIVSGDDLLVPISLNHDSRELMQPYHNFESISDQVEILQISDQMEEQLIEARTGQELWRIFLFLALMMLLSEMLLIKKLEGSRLK